ncbi:hypothetical protein [Acrocarpospora pleiomorpha]|nr:hypothetical protein [Acrocarpospora pleiomorpha]
MEVTRMYATFHDAAPPAPAERYLLQRIGDGPRHSCENASAR